MEKEWDLINVLRHSRHDWLNRLQIIKGNLDLNRIDRAKAVIDEIVMEAQHETKLSNIHMPLLAALLITSNWENPLFRLEYEVLEDLPTIKIDDAAITNWTKSFFSCLNKAIEAFQENHLSITIEPQSSGVRFFLDFSGIIVKRELIKKFLSEPGQPEMDVMVKEFTQSELALEVYMPSM